MHRYSRVPHRLPRCAALATLLAALLAGLFLLPVTALAAPAITLTPDAIPPGGTITVTGTGFAPGAQLELFIAIPQFHDARVKMADLTASAAGGFTTTIRENGFAAPERITVVVTGGGGDLAQAVYTITDAPSIAPERLTIAPSTGPVGTRFTATATGLTPGLAVVAFTTESALGPQGHFRALGTVTVPADGRVIFPIDTTGYDPQGYDLIVFGPGGPTIGLPLVIAQFMVTGAGAPAPADDPAVVVRRFFDTRNRYDIAGTLALVTEDVRLIGGPRCTESAPCVGKDAVRTDLQNYVAQHAQSTIVGTPLVTGTTVRIRVEARDDTTRAAGVDRFVNDVTVETRDGKLASLRAVSDLSDPQTAEFFAYVRAHPQPGGPMPGLPNTGAGGGTDLPLGRLVLLACGVLAVGGRLLRHRVYRA